MGRKAENVYVFCFNFLLSDEFFSRTKIICQRIIYLFFLLSEAQLEVLSEIFICLL